MGTTTLLSFEEFLNLPDLHAGKRELIEGELVELPPATAPHNRIANRIVFALREYLRDEAQSQDRACVELGFEIPARKRSWLQPDAALLHPGQPLNRASYYEGAPLIAIEVISPSNRTRDTDRRWRIYLANGCEEVWIVSSASQTVATKRANDPVWIEHEHAITSALLPGFRLDFTELFQQP